MKKLLLHICCAPCGTYVSRERLAPHYDLTWYFCNPNLVSEEEYGKRLEAVKLMAAKFNFPLIIEPYNHEAWRLLACSRASDPEKGERCRICYRDRLAQTARLAKDKGFDIFGTTLLVSPYKDATAIIEIGKELEEMNDVEFLDMDFQADDGYRCSQNLAKELGIYRQKFCGCEYSLNQITPKKKAPFIAGLLMAAFILFQAGAVRAADLNASTSLDIDSDSDGFSDTQEINSGYSPYNPAKVRLDKNDADKDGLNDYLELKFKTDPLNPDSDGDGHKDGAEIDFAYNPLSSSTVKLTRKIEINLKTQKLSYLVGGQVWKEFSVSSGKASMPTPKGNFKIINKNIKAWSNTYKLWMPYWMGLGSGQFGIHELPLWPSGYREGANHIGTPVSHGCIRLAIGAAKYIYDRVDTGVEVMIK